MNGLPCRLQLASLLTVTLTFGLVLALCVIPLPSQPIPSHPVIRAAADPSLLGFVNDRPSCRSR